MALRVHGEGEALALEVSRATTAPAQTPPAALPVGERVLLALVDAPGPLSVAALRQTCRIRTATLCEVLATLTAQGRVRKTDNGYVHATA